MELIFLGTTAAIPTSVRGHSAIAIKYGDEIILWDCGEGTQRQLITSKTSYMRINKIFITHFHGDHLLGLPGLIQTMAFAGRSEDLHIYAPHGIKDQMDRILGIGEYTLSFKIRIHEIFHGYEVEGKGYKIKAIRVEHSIPCFGLVFEEKKGRVFLVEKAKALGIKPGPMYKKLQRGEKVKIGERWIYPEDVLGEKKKGIKIVYSSDTRPCENVIRSCENSILIHDSTFDHDLLKNAIENYHSTCVEAANVAREGKARKLFLTHISPRYKTVEKLLSQAREVFRNVEVAEDLMRIKLKSKDFER